MSFHADNAQDRNGNALGSATVTVTPIDGGTASLFSDSVLSTPKVNPITTDANGLYWFYAAAGLYTLTITKTGFTTQTFTAELGGDAHLVITGAALRVEAPSAISVQTLGANIIGDGGGGVWYGVTGAAPGTYVDNTGTVLIPAASDGSAAWLRVYDGAVSLKWFGVDATGVTDATTAVQKWLAASLDCFAPLGTYKVSAQGTLRSGHKIRGASQLGTTFAKTDYIGPVFLGVDVDQVSLEDFAITGPGAAVGTGNKGIDIHISVNEICTNIVFRNLYITAVNDAGIYAGTCSFVTWDNVRVRTYGFAGLWVEGGDGHTFNGCSTRLGIVGFYVNNAAGYGPTTMAFSGCYAEQAGAGWKIKGGVCITLRACGVEAAIDYSGTGNPEIGYSYWIIGGTNIRLEGCLARNDTIGADINCPFVLVDTAASKVVIDGFQREVSVTYGAPAVELECAAAGDVTLGLHNFTGGSISSSGKISTYDKTAVP